MRHICRICFGTKPRKDVTELDIMENGIRQTYKDVLLFCLGIQINEDSKANTKLCVKCYRKIIEFYKFKVLAIRNDENGHLAVCEESDQLNNIFFMDENIKMERDTEDDNSDGVDCLEETLIPIKDENDCDDDDLKEKVKYELEKVDPSDDEILSVIKHLKYQPDEEVKPKARAKVKRVKLTLAEIKERKKKHNGKTEGMCGECGNVFKDLRLHLQTHLPKEQRRQVKCEHCEKKFFNNAHKRKHVQRRHLGVKYTCHLCDKSVADLKTHIKSMHNKDALKFECVHCKLKFLTQARLTCHITTHTKDRPFECDVCGKCFRQKLSLNHHKRQVHDKERSHLCQFCSKSFFKKHHLNIHLRSHTNEKPYECPDCGKFFQTTTSLKNHRLRHTNEKNVSCTLCDAKFISKSYLANHMVSHTKVKRYPCQFCDVRFHRSDHRKRHQYTAHLKHMSEATSVLTATLNTNSTTDALPESDS